MKYLKSSDIVICRWNIIGKAKFDLQGFEYRDKERKCLGEGIQE